jgi:hypothetical protein
MSPEDVASKIREISDFSRKNDYPTKGDDTFARILNYRNSLPKPKL